MNRVISFIAQLDQLGVNLHRLLDAHLLESRRAVDQDEVQIIGLECL